MGWRRRSRLAMSSSTSAPGQVLLGLPAVGAGATRVYAIERGEIIVLARQIARQNGLEDRISFIQGDARHVEIERRADLVVGELIGSLGLDGDIITIFCDARKLTSSNREGACYRMASISSSLNGFCAFPREFGTYAV